MRSVLVRQVMRTIEDKTLAWLVSGDTGSSSIALCASFFGFPKNDRFNNYPGDPSDFGRCIRFLETLSKDDKRLALEKVRTLSREWEALVEKWDYLESIYGKNNMFQEMQNIINTVRGTTGGFKTL